MNLNILVMNTVVKLFLGRKVKEEHLFKKEKGVTFGAYYAACAFVKEKSWFYGSMDAGGRGNPIAIIKDNYTLPEKWHNFSKSDKQRCDGVMISEDWREGDVKIIMFEDKVIL